MASRQTAKFSSAMRTTDAVVQAENDARHTVRWNALLYRFLVLVSQPSNPLHGIAAVLSCSGSGRRTSETTPTAKIQYPNNPPTNAELPQPCAL